MTNGFRSDKDWCTALADTKQLLQALDFNNQSDMGQVAFQIARVGFPHSFHAADLCGARLVFDWIIACNREGYQYQPEACRSLLVNMAIAATPEQQIFARRNTSLADLIPNSEAVPVMSLAA